MQNVTHLVQLEIEMAIGLEESFKDHIYGLVFCQVL